MVTSVLIQPIAEEYKEQKNSMSKNSVINLCQPYTEEDSRKPSMSELTTYCLGYCHYGEVRIGHYDGEWHVFVNGEHWQSDKDKDYLEQRFEPTVLDDDFEQELLSQIIDQEDLIERDYVEDYWNLSPSKGYYE